MADSIDVDVRMEEEDNESFQCRVNVLVADQSGSPLPEATMKVNSESYNKEKSAEDHGMRANFAQVPLPANMTITASGYKDVDVKLTKEDINGTVRHNW